LSLPAGASIDANVDSPHHSHLTRPSLPLSLILDASLAAAAYLVCYWLRFQPDQRLGEFLPRAWSTTPLVVAAQLAALGLIQAYVPRPRANWLARVVIGVVIGSAAAAGLVKVLYGFAGIARVAFAADAVLFSIAALGWRAVWALHMRDLARARATATAGVLVDRAAEMMTLGAVIKSLYSYRELLKILVLRDLKLKYRGSVFGFVWSLVNPLMMIIVYTVAFTFILRVRSAGFVFYLMLGQLSWAFFANSAAMSTGAIIDNAGLIRSVFFPRAILPMSTVLFNLSQYLLTSAVFLPVMLLWYHVPPSSPMLAFPIFLALQATFTIGVALILSTLTAFFRDVKHLLEIALAMLFWTTPIVYELSMVPERFRLLVLLSPVSSFVVAYQQIFFYQVWPAPTVWLIAITYALGAFVIGASMFLAFENRFTEQL
jgi:lipopolysaccharide transport system permease protein